MSLCVRRTLVQVKETGSARRVAEYGRQPSRLAPRVLTLSSVLVGRLIQLRESPLSSLVCAVMNLRNNQTSPRHRAFVFRAARARC